MSMMIGVFCGQSYSLAFFTVVIWLLFELVQSSPKFYVRSNGTNCHYYPDNQKIERFFVYKQMYIFVTPKELYYLHKMEAELCGKFEQINLTENDRIDDTFTLRKYLPKSHKQDSGPHPPLFCAIYPGDKKTAPSASTGQSHRFLETTSLLKRKVDHVFKASSSKDKNDAGHNSVVINDYHILYQCTEKTKDFCHKNDDSFFLNEHTGKLHFFPASESTRWKFCRKWTYTHMHKIAFLFSSSDSDTEESDSDDSVNFFSSSESVDDNRQEFTEEQKQAFHEVMRAIENDI